MMYLNNIVFILRVDKLSIQLVKISCKKLQKECKRNQIELSQIRCSRKDKFLDQIFVVCSFTFSYGVYCSFSGLHRDNS